MKPLLAWLENRRLGLLALGGAFIYLAVRVHSGLSRLADLPRGLDWLRSLAGEWSWQKPGTLVDALLASLAGQWDPSAALLLNAGGEAVFAGLLLWFVLHQCLGRRSVLPLGLRPLALFGCGCLSLVLWQQLKPAADPEALLSPGHRAALLQSYQEKGDARILTRELGLGVAEASEAECLLSDPRVLSRLPALGRLALMLEPEEKEGCKYGEASKAAPLNPGQQDFLAWTVGQEGRGGRFVSAELRAELRFLRLRLAGKVGEGSRLYLLGEGGQTEELLQRHVNTEGRWRQVTFRNPGTPFRLIVELAPGQRLAFSAPVELSLVAWLAGKLLPFAGVVGWAGLVLGFGSGIWVVARALGGACLDSIPVSERRLYPWVFLGLWAVVLCYHTDPYAGGSDSSGYLNLAAQLLDGRLQMPLERAPGLEDLPIGRFVPLGYVSRGEGMMVPTYPLGLPLLFAAAGFVMPLDWASSLTSVLHLLAMILVTRSLARTLGASESWAWAAGWLAGLSPMTVFIGLQPMSDLPAAVWTTAALLLALKARATPRLALAAGAAVGMAVLLRPTNLLVIFPVLLVLVWAPGVGALWLGKLVYLGLGGLPFAVILALYNTVQFGGPLTTGYGNPSSLFSAEWLGMTLMHYGRWLPLLLGPLVLLAVRFPFVRSVPLVARVTLSGWILLLTGVYALYACTHEAWWYHRFVLPVFPSLAVASVLGAEDLIRKLFSRWRYAAPLAGLVVAGNFCHLFWQGDHLLWMQTAEDNRGYKEAVLWVEQREPRALVAGLQVSGALLHYTKLGFVDARAPLDTPRVLAAARKTGRPLYAVVFDFEKEFLESPSEGSWEKVHETTWIRIYRWCSDKASLH